MIYITENIALVPNAYITINRGDIVAGYNFTAGTIMIFRIVRNKRDF